MNLLLTALVGLGTSFVGSFTCFVLWVHFDFDARWEKRKYEHHAEKLRREELRDAEKQLDKWWE